MSVLTGFLLIVDDSDRFTPVIEMAYAKKRLEIVSVKNTKSAKRVLLERQPEAILCGLRLGGEAQGGIKFSAELKSHPELSKIPVFLIANELNDGLIREASEQGAKGIIAWPASVQVIRKRLEPFIPDYLTKEKTPEEIRQEQAKLPNILQDELEVERILDAGSSVGVGVEDEKFDLAKRILAQVLHNLKSEGVLGDAAVGEIPKIVSEMTSKVCKVS